MSLERHNSIYNHSYTNRIDGLLYRAHSTLTGTSIRYGSLKERDSYNFDTVLAVGSFVLSVAHYRHSLHFISADLRSHMQLEPNEQFILIDFIPFKSSKHPNKKNTLIHSSFLLLTDGIVLAEALKNLHQQFPHVTKIFGSSHANMASLAAKVGFNVSEFRYEQMNRFEEHVEIADIFSDDITAVVERMYRMFPEELERHKKLFSKKNLTERMMRIYAIAAFVI